MIVISFSHSYAALHMPTVSISVPKSSFSENFAKGNKLVILRGGSGAKNLS